MSGEQHTQQSASRGVSQVDCCLNCLPSAAGEKQRENVKAFCTIEQEGIPESITIAVKSLNRLRAQWSCRLATTGWLQSIRVSSSGREKGRTCRRRRCGRSTNTCHDDDHSLLLQDKHSKSSLPSKNKIPLGCTWRASATGGGVSYQERLNNLLGGKVVSLPPICKAIRRILNKD